MNKKREKGNNFKKDSFILENGKKCGSLTRKVPKYFYIILI